MSLIWGRSVGILMGSLSFCSCQPRSGSKPAKPPVQTSITGDPASTFDAQSALTALEFASRSDAQGLLRLVTQGRSTNERLFAGYLLYRMDRIRYTPSFVRTFPDSEQSIQDFVGLQLPDDPVRETASVSRPDVKWDIGFWSIEQAMLEVVKSGDPLAVSRFMRLEGRGDGEIGEGLASDIGDLYIHEPALVVRHWDVFKDHLEFLDELDGWYSSQEIQKARGAYKTLLGPSDPRLTLILKHFDQTH